jgi:hypothetical protein
MEPPIHRISPMDRRPPDRRRTRGGIASRIWNGWPEFGAPCGTARRADTGAG